MLGIDAGGSKTVAWLADAAGQVVGEGRGGGANLHSAGELGTEKVLYEVIQAAVGDRRAAAGAWCASAWPAWTGPTIARSSTRSSVGSDSAARFSRSTTRWSRSWPAPTRRRASWSSRAPVRSPTVSARRDRRAGRRLGRSLRRRRIGVLGRAAGTGGGGARQRSARPADRAHAIGAAARRRRAHRRAGGAGLRPRRSPAGDCGDGRTGGAGRRRRRRGGAARFWRRRPTS